MIRRKKGSSLLMVIMVFAILSIAGTSVVSMTSNDYYRRVNETEKLENLYGAESGLDITYNVLAKNFESAVTYSNLAVTAILKDSNADTSLQKEIERVKNGQEVYYKKSSGNTKESRIVNKDGTVNSEEYNELEKETFRVNFNKFIGFTIEEVLEGSKILNVEKYVAISDVENDGAATNLEKLDSKGVAKIDTLTNTELVDSVIVLEDLKANILKNNGQVNNEENEKYDIEITSEYKQSDGNPRKIRANYSITIPEYKYYVNSTNVEMQIHPLFNKVVAIDGDMSVLSDTLVNGDMFVRGTGELKGIDGTNTFLYDKYKGGVEVSGTANSTTNFELQGDLATTRSVKLRSYTHMRSLNDIFASSFAMGKTKESDDNNTQINFINDGASNGNAGLYLSNDLAINGENINATMDNFYGINDISDSNKAINSSSIILNSNKNSTLNIRQRAYIWGTAYINTESKYQTGESVAVKGNYLAYSDSLGKDVEFDYDKPLQLISKINGKDATVFDKAEHIKEYYKENPGNLNLVGITLPAAGNDMTSTDVATGNYPTGTYTVGAYITQGKIENKLKNNIPQIENDQIKKMKEEYMDEVYYMGISDYIEAEDKNDPLLNLSGNFPLSPVNPLTISSEIDFSKLVNKNEVDVDGNRIIFNNDPEKIITIKGDNSGKPVTGLIISAGDVIFEGKVNFKGAVISAKDFVCKNENGVNDQKIELLQDLNLVRKLIAKNYKGHLEYVIKKHDGLPTEKLEVGLEEVNDTDTKFPVKDYVNKGNWKIEATN